MVMNTEIDDDGLIIKRDMSANDYPIEEEIDVISRLI